MIIIAPSQNKAASASALCPLHSSSNFVNLIQTLIRQLRINADQRVFCERRMLGIAIICLCADRDRLYKRTQLEPIFEQLSLNCYVNIHQNRLCQNLKQIVLNYKRKNVCSLNNDVYNNKIEINLYYAWLLYIIINFLLQAPLNVSNNFAPQF